MKMEAESFSETVVTHPTAIGGKIPKARSKVAINYSELRLQIKLERTNGLNKNNRLKNKGDQLVDRKKCIYIR
jgi:hypothetical protein